MLQKMIEPQNELSGMDKWYEELPRKQRYEEAAYNRDRERLLCCEMARLRLKLTLRKEFEKE